MANPLAYLDQELNELREKGLFRWPRLLEGPQEPVARYDGREVINLCSNNYLGLANHARLKAAARRAVDELGVGSGAVRTIAGNMAIHKELEEELARFKHTEATLLYQSGFTANAGTVAALLGKDDVIVSDELNHASIIDGARLSGAEKKIYPHKDVAAARRLLEASRGARRTLLITDGVFSMDGDVAPLPDLVALAEEFGAIMMVDDAHASGVMGQHGRGTVDHFRLHGRVHIQVGTLSKAFAAQGGYVAGSRTLIDYLIHRARPLLFSTSHPPSVAASALAAPGPGRARAHRTALGQHADLQTGPQRVGIQHGGQRDAHYAGCRWRRAAGHRSVRPAVHRRGVCAGDRFPHCPAREGQGPHNCDRRPHPDAPPAGA